MYVRYEYKHMQNNGLQWHAITNRRVLITYEYERTRYNDKQTRTHEV